MRNLLIRTLSGILYVALVVVSLLWVRPLLLVLGVAALYLCLHEFYQMCIGPDGFEAQRYLAMLSALGLLVLVWCSRAYGMPERYIYLSLLPILFLWTSQVLSDRRFDLNPLSRIACGLLYIAVPFSLMPMLVFRPDGYDGTCLLSMFILVWACDVGAYLVGTLLGQKPDSRKLAPEISPKKSWWGVVGSLAFCLAAAVILYFTGLLALPPGHCIGLAILICVTSIFGDLFESLWKRHYGLKDSGNLIPGHGGILDRLDSILFAQTAVFLYLSIFNLL